jgi:hypothetical protein
MFTSREHEILRRRNPIIIVVGDGARALYQAMNSLRLVVVS